MTRNFGLESRRQDHGGFDPAGSCLARRGPRETDAQLRERAAWAFVFLFFVGVGGAVLGCVLLTCLFDFRSIFAL